MPRSLEGFVSCSYIPLLARFESLCSGAKRGTAPGKAH